jgi:hypothetical protein
MAFPAPQEGPYPYGMATSTTQYGRNAFYFATSGGGGGGGSTLQSPASVTPDTVGNATLNVIPDGNNRGTINIGDAGGLPNVSAVLSLASGGTGFSEVDIGGVALNTYGLGNTMTISQTGSPLNQVAKFNTAANITDIGNPLNAGAIYLNNTTTVTSSGSRPPVGGILLQQLTSNSSSIGQQVASGGVLVLGSSVAQPQIISISDTGASVTGTLSTTGTATVPDLVVNGTALISGSLTADDIVLTGASSAIQVPGQGGAGQPPVGITMSATQTLVGNLELQASQPGIYNGGIVGQASFNFVINSTGQPAGVIGNTGAQVGGPAALGDLSAEGLYIVSLVVSNASTDIYSKLAQIRTVSYWNPTTGWFGGSGGNSSFGGAEYRAGINPSNVIAPGQLWVTNTSGNNWTGMSVNLTQITGTIPGYFVA